MEHSPLRVSRRPTLTKWINNPNPKYYSFPVHGDSAVTRLISSHGRFIVSTYRGSINVYSPNTCRLTMSLDGHKLPTFALSATKDILVSGSNDHTIRIWDLNTGRCTHTFGGHTSTVDCLTIVKPEWVEVTGVDGVIRREKWPKRTMIVTGSEDNTLRVWLLPRLGEVEDQHFRNGEGGIDHAEVWLHSHFLTAASANTIFV